MPEQPDHPRFVGRFDHQQRGFGAEQRHEVLQFAHGGTIAARMECHNLGMQPFAPLIARKLARCRPMRRGAATRPSSNASASSPSSDFALARIGAQPELLERLRADEGAAPIPPPQLAADNRGEWPRLLRRYRQAESTRLVWRGVVAGDPVEAILAGSTRLAETCLRLALAALEGEFAERHGVVRALDFGLRPTLRTNGMMWCGWSCSGWASSAAAN